VDETVIRELHIENYVLVEKANLVFSPKFNIITGETGAGKSILVGALQLLLGHRGEKDAIRKGSNCTLIEGLVDTGNASAVRTILEEGGIIPEDNEIIITRELRSDGRNRCFVNSRRVPLSILRSLGEHLVDLHGQHQHQSLLYPSRQCALLDGFGGLRELKREVGELFEEMRRIRKAITQREGRIASFRDRKDFIAFQIEEIESSQLEVHEDAELKQELSILQNHEKIFMGIDEVCALLQAEDNAPVTGIHRVESIFRDLSHFDHTLSSYAGKLSDLCDTLKEIAYFAQNYRENHRYDPDRIEELNSRLSLIERLKRKYGSTIKDILEYRKNLRKEFDEMTGVDGSLDPLRAQLSNAESMLADKVKRLSEMRFKAADRLSTEVTSVLSGLGMPSARFSVHIEQLPCNDGDAVVRIGDTCYRVTQDGMDHVEFHLAANPGEDAKKLSLVASGGEISRIMLALKTICAGADEVSTMVFDEIDVGIGGSMSVKVGETLKKASRNHQVICVTHLPMIAKNADRHFHVKKDVVKDRTVTTIEEVKANERVKEIARMLSGDISETTLQHACDILNS
jgi:DNA repair protein RecN (Recombination protein N)